MLVIFPVLVFILSQYSQYYSTVEASNNIIRFGYHCAEKESKFDLPYNELRKVCSKIPTVNRLDLDPYKIGSIACSPQSYGVRGPCGENKIFVERQHERIPCGACVCNDNGPRKLLYHPPTNKCFYIYEQGFCPEGSLIALNHTTQRLGCKQNPCHSDNVFNVEFNGKCVELYTRAEGCKVNEFLGFEWDNPEPKCTKNYQEVTEVGVMHESEEDISPGFFTTQSSRVDSAGDGTTLKPDESEEDISPGGFTTNEPSSVDSVGDGDRTTLTPDETEEDIQPGGYTTTGSPGTFSGGSGITYENEEVVQSHGQLPVGYSTTTTTSSLDTLTPSPSLPRRPTTRPPLPPTTRPPQFWLPQTRPPTFTTRPRTTTRRPGGGGGIFRFRQDLDECPPGQQLSISGRCAGSWQW